MDYGDETTGIHQSQRAEFIRQARLPDSAFAAD
jgi:hypothetical protein